MTAEQWQSLGKEGSDAPQAAVFEFGRVALTSLVFPLEDGRWCALLYEGNQLSVLQAGDREPLMHALVDEAHLTNAFATRLKAKLFMKRCLREYSHRLLYSLRALPSEVQLSNWVRRGRSYEAFSLLESGEMIALLLRYNEAVDGYECLIANEEVGVVRGNIFDTAQVLLMDFLLERSGS